MGTRVYGGIARIYMFGVNIMTDGWQVARKLALAGIRLSVSMTIEI